MIESDAAIATRPAAGSRSSALSASGLTKRYGPSIAVDRVEFEVAPDVVSGFVGPNGAGKTTTIPMLLGLIRRSEGTTHVFDQPITDPPAYLARVGALIEAPGWPSTSCGLGRA